jgi:hypothetical protein
MKLNERKEEKK